MHPRLLVSAMSTSALDVNGDLAFWRRWGIRSVGLSLRKLESAGLEESVERIKRDGLRATLESAVDLIRLVQLSDYVVGTLRTPDRAVPGDGHIPLGRIVGWLEAAGYRGVYDLELMGPRIEAEGYDRAIPRAVERAGSILAAAGT